MNTLKPKLQPKDTSVNTSRLHLLRVESAASNPSKQQHFEKWRPRRSWVKERELLNQQVRTEGRPCCHCQTLTNFQSLLQLLRASNGGLAFLLLMTRTKTRIRSETCNMELSKTIVWNWCWMIHSTTERGHQMVLRYLPNILLLKGESPCLRQKLVDISRVQKQF